MGAALVTGGAKRLGAAIASHLAAKGHDVAIHYNTSEADARELAVGLAQKYNIKSAIVQGDLRDRERLTKIVPEAASALGRSLDILVNNASTMRMDRVDDQPRDDFQIWDDNMRTNLEAPYWLTRGFAAQFKGGENGDGVVINMIDQRVLRPTPNYTSYALAKTALHSLTKTAAMALAPRIRVNGIGPGTTLIGEHQSEDNFELHRKLSILERGADVEDILQAVDYLINARAVTGQMIAVDGGQHLIWKLPKS